MDTTAIRSALESNSASLPSLYDQRVPVGELIEGRTCAVDIALTQIWEEIVGNPADAALVAVGGYGRRELMPHSDVDVLILTRHTESIEIASLEQFITSLWDLNLDIGSSVRSIDQCATESEADLTVATSLLEARTLCGDDSLRQSMFAAIGPDRMWPAAEFYHAKVAEQRHRHRRYDNTEHNLEPNIKQSPGGLRDIQTIRWVARRHFGTDDLSLLQNAGFLTIGERKSLADIQDFLWNVRFGLHLEAARGEDRLLFDHQRALADRLGYRDSEGELAVEAFMHDYFRNVMELAALNDLLLQHFTEAYLSQGGTNKVRNINDRFQVRNDYLEVTSPLVFRDTPSALMEMFVILGQDASIVGVRSGTIRLIREHLDLVDETFRTDARVTRAFMDFLQSDVRLYSHLSRMRRYGILARYLPEFGRVIGQMQHDLFHIYTVDAHTLQVVRNLRRFRLPNGEEDFPVASHCVRNVPRMDILYIAAIYHDIAKGRGGDHSELGATDVRDFCVRHCIDEEHTDLAVWLVKDHLIMSTTAQRMDISDPVVIGDFADRVGTAERLDYLYALTVADINATNPNLWNGFRATLLRQLYLETKRAL